MSAAAVGSAGAQAPAGMGAQTAMGAGAGDQPQETLSRERCPLCGAPLKPTQDWCLRCGAAARTRLAAQPKWKALAIALLLVVVLSLGVLTAALVKLAG